MPAETPDPWAVATWEGNERDQILRSAKWTLLEKVKWLEGAQRIANALQAASAKKESPNPAQSNVDT